MVLQDERYISETIKKKYEKSNNYRGFLVKEDNTTFAYDGNGNITRAGDKVFTYDSVIKDRLTSVDDKAITYSESNHLNPKTRRHRLRRLLRGALYQKYKRQELLFASI